LPVSIYTPGTPSPLIVSCFDGFAALPACISHILASRSAAAAALILASLFHHILNACTNWWHQIGPDGFSFLPANLIGKVGNSLSLESGNPASPLRPLLVFPPYSFVDVRIQSSYNVISKQVRTNFMNLTSRCSQSVDALTKNTASYDNILIT
jgi:hypothetical protein